MLDVVIEASAVCPVKTIFPFYRWFAGDIGKVKAEEMLNSYREDGAFLIRFSSLDNSVFVLSLR